MTSASKPLVAHVITGLGVGGAERMLANILRSGASTRHAILVLSNEGVLGPELTSEGQNVIPLNAKSRWELLHVFSKLRAELRKLRPDIVQSWLIHANLAAAFARPANTPLAWNVRQSLDGLGNENGVTRRLVKVSGAFANKPDVILFNSHTAARQHHGIGYPAGSSVIIPNGFDLERASSSRSGRNKTRQALGLAKDDFAVGYVARAHPIKNHGAFLAAVSELMSAYPRLRPVLVGQGTERGGALHVAVSSELQNRGIWCGERSDVLDITGALDVAVNVSFGEAFSNSLGEAMACAVPCAATDVGDSAMILGDTGWVISGFSKEAIRGPIENALNTAPGELSLMGERARQRIERSYSIPAIVEQYEKLYHELAGSRSLSTKHR